MRAAIHFSHVCMDWTSATVSWDIRAKVRRTHRAGGFQAELGQRLWGKLEVCRQSRLRSAAEGRLAVGGGSLWGREDNVRFTKDIFS